MTIAKLEREGEARRDAGMARAADRQPHSVARGELALLDALMASPGATATTDAIAADPRASYACGGKWVGSVPMKLLKAGIIAEVGYVRSIRPSRHRGLTRLYTIADASKAHARRETLWRFFATLEAKQLQNDSLTQPSPHGMADTSQTN